MRDSLGSITPLKPLVAVFATLIAVGCWLSHPTASPKVAAVLDSLLPGVSIGARALPVAKRMHLAYEPYAGYLDTSYQNQAGVRGLVLQVSPDPESEGQNPSRWARITTV